MNRSERDVLLVRLDEHDGSDGFHATLISIVLRALVKALPVEDSFSSEELAAISADDSAPKPDFAAMAKRYQNSWSGSLADFLASEWPKPPPAPVERDQLRKEGVTRHPQWAFSAAANVVPCVSCGCAMVVDNAKCDVCRKAPVERQTSTGVTVAGIRARAEWLRSSAGLIDQGNAFDRCADRIEELEHTFDAPVAFDVEAFASAVQDRVNRIGNNVHAAYYAVVAVAKEQGPVQK